MSMPVMASAFDCMMVGLNAKSVPVMEIDLVCSKSTCIVNGKYKIYKNI